MEWYRQEVCDRLGYHPWPGNGNGVRPDREVACCVQSLLLLIPAWYARSRSILPLLLLIKLSCGSGTHIIMWTQLYTQLAYD